jgi:hypothetical protein
MQVTPKAGSLFHAKSQLRGTANDVRFFAPPYWKIDQCAERAARDPRCPWAERRLGPALSFLARQGERFASALVVLGELHWRGGWND